MDKMRLMVTVRNGEFFSQNKHISVAPDFPDHFESYDDMESPFGGIEICCGCFDHTGRKGFVKIEVYGPSKLWRKYRDNLTEDETIALCQIWYDSIYSNINGDLTLEMITDFGLKEV